MKKIFLLLVTFVIMLGLTACESKSDENISATKVTHLKIKAEKSTTATASNATKDNRTTEDGVKKCVIYSSALGTILDAFGKSDCIVGAYGSLAEAYNVPSCGKWNEVDVEAVISTGAEVVFGYKNYIAEEQINTLKKAGITCYFIELSNADTVAMEISELGELFSCEEKAKAFVDFYTRYDTLMKERLAGITALTAYVEGNSVTPRTANHTSAAHKLVMGAGLVNVYAENETQYPERNLEDLIVKNPQIIVKLLSADDTLDDTTYNKYKITLAGVLAADNDKIILINSDCGTTAIGAVIGRLYLAKYVYPQLFADIDVDEVYEKFCTEFLGKEYTGSGAFFK